MVYDSIFAEVLLSWYILKLGCLQVYFHVYPLKPILSLQQSVKVDINIEKDLAYALKVKEGPQILFLRGNRILYREKGESSFIHFQVLRQYD